MKLLPCPFCNEEPTLWDLDGEWAVHCATCDMSRDAYIEQDDAVKDWNTRAPLTTKEPKTPVLDD